ncbi:MAG: Bug family tripartite tricarboxylate transporter substrate binding protein [Pseudolabrys sp.]
MRIRGAIALAIFSLLSVPAFADYPERPIRLIVPQAAGSNTDVYARLLAAEMAKTLGQQLIVENRPGGAFVIGLDAIAKSQPDGYTVGVGLIGGMALTPHMVAKLPYSIEKDFVPIGLMTRGHMMLAVSPNLPVKSVKELIDYAKKNPGKLSMASSATGSPGHLCGELFKTMTGTQITHVPYRGGAPAINDLIAGRVDIMFEGLGSLSPFAKDGRVRAIAVSGPQRSPAFPDVPTVAEAGVPGFEMTVWLGIVGPANLPRPMVEKLNRSINDALKSQLMVERFKQIGEEPWPGSPENYSNVIKTDFAKWKGVIEGAGIKLQ